MCTRFRADGIAVMLDPICSLLLTVEIRAKSSLIVVVLPICRLEKIGYAFKLHDKIANFSKSCQSRVRSVLQVLYFKFYKQAA